jgi:hypothetical protein
LEKCNEKEPVEQYKACLSDTLSNMVKWEETEVRQEMHLFVDLTKMYLLKIYIYP